MEQSFEFPPHSVIVKRSYLPGAEFLLMELYGRPLFEGFDAWVRDNDLPRPDGPALELLQGLLAAVCTWVTFQPNDSMVAWTFALPELRYRIFVAADAGERSCVARWSPYASSGGPEHPLFHAQLRRRGAPVQQSTIDPSGTTAVGLVAEFFARSQQNPGRLFYDPREEIAQLLVAVADHDLAWLRALDGIPEGHLIPEDHLPTRRPIHDPQLLQYRCGCSSERIRKVVLSAAGDNVAAVFGNEAEVEVECPRCGRSVVLRRP
ncbi:MAG: Hsp33 family molecular chaperone HslO [Planctomycetes bacterium]|nr:Hsp33 family molecular chaperone HslO [Planctomycetota bacterium]